LDGHRAILDAAQKSFRAADVAGNDAHRRRSVPLRRRGEERHRAPIHALERGVDVVDIELEHEGRAAEGPRGRELRLYRHGCLVARLLGCSGTEQLSNPATTETYNRQPPRRWEPSDARRCAGRWACLL